MLLVIDVGNTNTVLGVYDGETLLHHWRVYTDREKTSDEYAALMRNLFEGSRFSAAEIAAIAMASVVPPLILAVAALALGLSVPQPLSDLLHRAAIAVGID